MDTNATEQSISQDGFPTLDSMNQEQLTLFSLQDMAVTTTASVEELKEQLKTAREMLDQAYHNSQNFTNAEQSVKSAQDALKTVKQNVSRQPEVMSLEAKVKELRGELKEKKDTISSYAIEVYRLSGNTEFEKDGQAYEIKTVAKLVKRKQ